MQLTKHTDLALRVLMYLAVKDGEKVTVGEMADKYAASKNHLVKVVHKMVSLGYINSTQGRGGGLCLAIDLHEVTIGDVVRSMESILDVVDCDSNTCPLLPACRLKVALGKAMDTFLETLDTFTLDDLVKNKSHILKLVG